MIVIPIDRSTIRRNPKAGQLKYYEQQNGPIEYHLTVIQDGFEFRWLNGVLSSYIKSKEPNSIKYETVMPTQKLYELGNPVEPEYLFEHIKDVEYECENKKCGKKFKISDLVYNDYDEDFWPTNDCPYCGYEVKYEYEKFNKEMVNAI